MAPSAPSGRGLLVLIFVASAVVFLAGAFSCGRAQGWGGDSGRGNGNAWGNEGCSSYTAWALCAGLISMLVAFFMLIGEKIGALRDCTSKSAPFVAIFFCVWWLFGAGVITFAGPYTVVSNGYLGSWIAFFGSVLYGLEVSSAVQTVVGAFSGQMEKTGPAMAGVVLASIIELIAASVFCNNCQHFTAYAVAVGAVSLALCILIVLVPKCTDKLNQAIPYVVLLLFLWWLAGAIVLTFVAPFVWAGNGFFSTWVAVVCAALVYKDSDAPGSAQAAKASSAV